MTLALGKEAETISSPTRSRQQGRTGEERLLAVALFLLQEAITEPFQSHQQIESSAGQLEIAVSLACFSHAIYQSESEFLALMDDPEEAGCEILHFERAQESNLISPQWALARVKFKDGSQVLHTTEVLAFRGTAGAQDALVDACCPPASASELEMPGVSVHSGILMSMQAIWPKIEHCLSLHCKSGSLLITGHSLGGGYAKYSLARILVSHRHLNVSAYTFGAPQVFSASSVRPLAHVSNSLHCFVHGADLVPRLLSGAVSSAALRNFLQEDCKSAAELQNLLQDYKSVGSYHYISKDGAVYKGTCNQEEIKSMLKVRLAEALNMIAHHGMKKHYGGKIQAAQEAAQDAPESDRLNFFARQEGSAFGSTGRSLKDGSEDIDELTSLFEAGAQELMGAFVEGLTKGAAKEQAEEEDGCKQQ
jgi:hypothetical protein